QLLPHPRRRHRRRHPFPGERRQHPGRPGRARCRRPDAAAGGVLEVSSMAPLENDGGFTTRGHRLSFGPLRGLACAGVVALLGCDVNDAGLHAQRDGGGHDAVASGAGGAQPPGTGGVTGTGGAPGTGGTPGTGGAVATGGAPGSGGAPATGGAPGAGGRAPGSGGRPGGTGGAPADGGVLPRITVWIAGDSTVANGSTPCPIGWGGQFLPYFNGSVTVTNSAVGGRSVRTWLYNVQTVMDSTGECVLDRDSNGQPTIQARWQAMLNGMKAGDYLFIQFGINDSDPTCDRHVGLEAFKTSYGVMAQAAT